MLIWLIALLAYLVLALPSAILLVAALVAASASDGSSPTLERLSRPLEPTPGKQV
jgi:chromate transport protein ChrA